MMDPAGTNGRSPAGPQRGSRWQRGLRDAALVAACAALLAGADARADTFHVALDGDDATGDGSAGRPWGTIQYAVNAGIPALGGHTILAADGMYAGQTTLTRGFPGAVTVRAEHPYRAVLTNVDGGGEALRIYIDGIANLAIEGFVITNLHPSYPCDGGREPYYLIHIQDAEAVVLRDNVVFGNNAPGTCNEVLKINRGSDTAYPRNIRVQGNVFYEPANAGGSDLIDAVRPGELDVVDNLFFGRPDHDRSQSFITIKRQAPPPGTPRSPRFRIARNVFLHWGGAGDQAFLQFGEDGVAEHEVTDALVENNLFVGDSTASLAAPLQFKGVRGVRVRANTVVGDLPGGAYGLRLGTEGDNPTVGDVTLRNNIWCDATGTMGSRFLNSYGDVDLATIVLDRNLFWNGGNPLPTTGGILPEGDLRRVVEDPRLPADHSAIVLPSWDAAAGAFASGTTTIRDEFLRLVEAYAALPDGSPAIDAADPSDMPGEDIRNFERDPAPDLGAYERGATAAGGDADADGATDGGFDFGEDAGADADADADAAPPDGDDDGGCGCRSAAGHSSPTWLTALGGLALLLGRRRGPSSGGRHQRSEAPGPPAPDSAAATAPATTRHTPPPDAGPSPAAVSPGFAGSTSIRNARNGGGTELARRKRGPGPPRPLPAGRRGTMRRWWVGLAALVGLAGACGDDSTTGDVTDTPADDVGADADGDAEPDAADADADAGPDVPETEDDADGMDGETDAPPELVWGDCDVADWPAGYPTPADGVECTTIDVPLNHDDPAAGTIPLNVGRHRSRNFPTGLAVFHLSGGPGGAAVTQSGIIPRVMGSLRTNFDMVYVDQRGTGSLGYMDCPGGYPEGEDDWIDCASSYATRDLDHYLTVDAAHDIDFVRRVLGYERIYIRGGSYGTRLGLEVLRQHGETVIAAVLDGLAPPDLDLFGEGAGTFDHGIALLAADCAADPTCLAVAPDLLGDLRARREQLRTTPRPITLDGYPDVETEEYYLLFLEAFLLTADWRYRVPRAVHEALAGDHTRWNRLMSDATGYTVLDGTKAGSAAAGRAPFDWVPRRRPVLAHEYVSPGLFITVMCAEFYPNSGGITALEATAAAQEWPDDSHLQMARACPSWDVAPLAAALRQAVASDVPTLLMNGAIDLNTFAEWGEQAAATLSRSTNLVVPYATHSTMSVSCAAQIMTRFIMNDGDITAVDTSCLERLTPPAW